MASIREQILNGTYKPQYPQTSKQPTSKPILPTKKEDKKKGSVLGVLKALPTSIGEMFGGAIKQTDRFFDEKIALPIKAGLSKKTYPELLKEYRDENEKQKDPLHEAKVIAEYAKQKYGESSKKYNDITSNLNQEKKVNPLNMKYTDTDIYKRKEAGELSKAEETAYKIGGMVGGLLPTIGATMLTGNPLVGKVMFGAKAQQGYTEKALSEGKSELESNIYGTIMGAAELATEAIGFNPFKTTIPTGTKGILKDIFKSAVGEGIEEGIMEYVDSTVRSVGFKEKFDLKETTKEATESFVYGAVLGAIMDASQRGIASAVNVTNKIENNETPTKAEVEKAINDYKNNQPYAFKESVNEGLNKFKTNFEQDLNKLKEIDSLRENNVNLPYKENINNIKQQLDEDLKLLKDKRQQIIEDRNKLNLTHEQKKQYRVDELRKINDQIVTLENQFRTIENEILKRHGVEADVINANDFDGGKIIVYHQTNENLQRFDKNQATFFNTYEQPPAYGSKTIKGIIDIKKPLNVGMDFWVRGEQPKLIQQAIKDGYDAVTFTHDPSNPNKITQIISLNPTQNVKTLQQLDAINKATPYDFMQKNIPQDPTRESSYDFLPQQSQDKAQILPVSPKTETNILENYQQTQTTVKDGLDSLNQLFVNKGHYIDKLAKTTGNKNLTYKYDRMIGANAEGQYVIGTAQTNNEGKIIGKSINEIWKPAEDAGLVQEFSEYLLHKHNIDRYKQGKPVFGNGVTSEMSAKTAIDLETQYPQFIEWSKDINTFNKNELQNMQEAGLTTKETQEYLNATYDNYVRVKRNIESLPTDQKGKKTRVINPLKKATGGNADILPLKDSMAEQVIKTKRAIRRNDLGLELMNELKSSNKVEDFDMDNIVRQDQDGAVFTVFKEGQPYDVPITTELYKSLSNDLEMKIRDVEQRASLITKPVQKLSQVQRSLLTVDNPLFIATNFFKDIGDAPFNSKYPTKFFQNYAKAVSEYKNKGQYYQEYVANGGDANTYFEYDKGVKKAPKGAMKFIEKIRSANEAIEQYPRLAEYISTREAGGSILEAMYNSAEVTTNFKRGGDITKAFNRNGVNFLNASVQGLSKQYRNLTGVNGVKGYANLLLKATMFGIAPSVLNHLLLKDDEDYKDLSASQKDLYYLFKTGEGKFVRIPKGRAISIFGAAARRMLESAEGEEDAFKGLGTHAINQLAPNNPATDNILAPITQALSNKTWFGGDIVPLRLQNQLPKNQFDESTDMLSKFLGKNLNISPKKINYVLDQYSGGIGDVLLPMMTPQARSNPLSSKFTTDSVMFNKNVGKFFETVENQQKIANDMNASETDILKSKYLNSVRAETNDLYKEKRQIQMSDLSNKDKKEKLREIQAEINAILEDGLKGYKDVEEYSNYSRVADREYFKNSKNEWQRVDDKEVSEISKFNFDKNNYFKTKLEISKIKSNEKFSSEERKGKIIDTILKTKFTDEQKGYLYSKTYADTSNLIKANIPIDIYLKLQQQIKDIKSISDPNSNIFGKTISGSKKEQIVQQIQKLPTTRINKLMLYAMEGYALTSREKSEIFNHVDKLRITKKEKENIIKSMSNFQWLKNGKLKGW